MSLEPVDDDRDLEREDALAGIVLGLGIMAGGRIVRQLRSDDSDHQ